MSLPEQETSATVYRSRRCISTCQYQIKVSNFAASLYISSVWLRTGERMKEGSDGRSFQNDAVVVEKPAIRHFSSFSCVNEAHISLVIRYKKN